MCNELEDLGPKNWKATMVAAFFSEGQVAADMVDSLGSCNDLKNDGIVLSSLPVPAPNRSGEQFAARKIKDVSPTNPPARSDTDFSDSEEGPISPGFAAYEQSRLLALDGGNSSQVFFIVGEYLIDMMTFHDRYNIAVDEIDIALHIHLDRLLYKGAVNDFEPRCG